MHQLGWGPSTVESNDLTHEAFTVPFKHTGFMTPLLTSSYSLNALLFIHSSEIAPHGLQTT